jgi:hypothetical protein
VKVRTSGEPSGVQFFHGKWTDLRYQRLDVGRPGKGIQHPAWHISGVTQNVGCNIIGALTIYIGHR